MWHFVCVRFPSRGWIYLRTSSRRRQTTNTPSHWDRTRHQSTKTDTPYRQPVGTRTRWYHAVLARPPARERPFLSLLHSWLDQSSTRNLTKRPTSYASCGPRIRGGSFTFCPTRSGVPVRHWSESVVGLLPPRGGLWRNRASLGRERPSIYWEISTWMTGTTLRRCHPRRPAKRRLSTPDGRKAPAPRYVNNEDPNRATFQPHPCFPSTKRPAADPVCRVNRGRRRRFSSTAWTEPLASCSAPSASWFASGRRSSFRRTSRTRQCRRTCSRQTSRSTGPRWRSRYASSTRAWCRTLATPACSSSRPWTTSECRADRRPASHRRSLRKIPCWLHHPRPLRHRGAWSRRRRLFVDARTRRLGSRPPSSTSWRLTPRTPRTCASSAPEYWSSIITDRFDALTSVVFLY